MDRTYIDSDEARITAGEAYTVNLDFFDGRHFENLEVRCLFPITGPTRYISLLTEKHEEVAVIRNIDALMPESKAVIEEAIKEFYLIPKITRVLDREEKYGILKLRVDTDRGEREFEIRNRQSSIKTVYGTRVLIRDSNDNRYEIPDYESLDAKSLRLISTDL